MKKDSSPAENPPRSRMTRERRNRQLLDTAWKIVRNEGADELTLGRLAEEALVTKPVVYDHFGSREGLLAALYREYDERQIRLMETSLAAGDSSLDGTATIVASSYIGCVLAQGREIPGVVAALAGSPELDALRRRCEGEFMEKCAAALMPFTGGRSIAIASLRAMLGAAEALSDAAVNGEIDPPRAEEELVEIIRAMVVRSGRKTS